jgi:hypothetical protein
MTNSMSIGDVVYIGIWLTGTMKRRIDSCFEAVEEIILRGKR